MKPSDTLVTTLLAILKAGAAYMPIDPRSPPNHVEHIIKEAKPTLVVYDDNYQHSRFFAPVKAVKIKDLMREAHRLSIGNIPDEIMLTRGNDNTKAAIIYTSGSSGLPKGVRVSHHSLFHRFMWQQSTFPYSNSEEFCVFKTAFTFIDHVAELWCPLIAGKTLVVVPRDVVNNPERFVPILENFRVERFLGVPSLIRGILLYLNMNEDNKTKFMLQRVKLWISSGETLNIQLAHEFFDYFDLDRHKLVNFYGCTEVSSDATYYEITTRKQLALFERVPLGSPLPNMAIYLLDKEKKQVNEGEVGEIYCAGPMIADGYVGVKESPVFMMNPFDNSDCESSTSSFSSSPQLSPLPNSS